MPLSQREDRFSLVRQELESYPGRVAGSLRDTAAILVAVVLGMTLRVSGLSLALALLYLMQRERPGLTLRVGLHILSGAAVACFGSLLWVQLSDGAEMARFLGLAVGIFVAAFCMVATSIPLFWTMVGFYGFVDLAFWDIHRSSDAIVTSSLYNIASISIVVLCAVGVEYIFGTRHPSKDLNHELRKRVGTIRNFFFQLESSDDPRHNNANINSLRHAVIHFSHAGDTYLNELYERLRDSLPSSSDVPLGIHYRIGLILGVIDATVAFGIGLPLTHSDSYRYAYRVIYTQCDAILSGERAELAPLSSDTPWQLQDIMRQLAAYSESVVPTENSASTPPVIDKSSSNATPLSGFFLPGVFDTSDAFVYALKLTLAAMTCYTLYNAVDWPGILTCVVTVLFTGLSSTGAMKQKQLYRFSGAAIGGALAIFTVSVLYPNMDSITALILVITPVAFVAGWVARSPNMGYVGVQIAFGFFLTALPGFGAATQIAPARDRVIGVALGILVMWFIFDQLWPVRTTDTLHACLVRIKKATIELRQLLPDPDTAHDGRSFRHLRTAVSQELVQVYQLAFAARFEIGRHRKREIAKTRRLVKEIEELSAEFYATARRI